MEKQVLVKYANILLSAINIQKGQNLLIRAEPIHNFFASVLATEAYKRGARYVRFDNDDIENPRIYLSRIEYSNTEYLSYVPKFRLDLLKYMLEENWALIAIPTPEDPDFLASLDPERNGICAKSISETLNPLKSRIINKEISWLVAFAPTEKMAIKITGIKSGVKAIDKLWKILVPILHLDHENPESYWKEHSEILEKRAEKITQLGLSKISFKGPGTDLCIGISKDALWQGGSSKNSGGTKFIPNIPTEEVFTTPDCRVAEGIVTFTRPVFLSKIGKIIEKGWLEFHNGAVINYGAKIGKDALDTFFSLDQNANRIGEVSLVDGKSPIFESKKIFYNTLLDENAACHIALGFGYIDSIRGGHSMSNDALKSAGINLCTVHTDFMIGSPEIEVSGITHDNRPIKLMQNGQLII